MSRLSQRIERLETSYGAVTVLGAAPENWPRKRREAEIERLAREQGVTGAIEVVAIGQCWPAISEAAIVHVGDLQEVFDHVAAHGRRIGERTAA